MDFQLIPTPSLDFYVALNLGETAPLIQLRALLLSSITIYIRKPNRLSNGSSHARQSSHLENSTSRSGLRETDSFVVTWKQQGGYFSAKLVTQPQRDSEDRRQILKHRIRSKKNKTNNQG